MRPSGRRLDVLRPITFERNYTKNAAGSVLVAFGDTKVICTASFEDRVPGWLAGRGQGWITAEYSMMPGATHPRTRRDAYTKGRSQEISRLIGRSLRAVADMRGIGECQITIDCDVLQADGGTRTAAVTGGYVALHDALQQSVDRGNLKQLPLKTTCAGVSVGVVGGEICLDLDYEEDYAADVDMNLVMDGQGQWIEVQGSAENRPFTRAELDAMLAMGEDGLRQLAQLQRKALSLG